MAEAEIQVKEGGTSLNNTFREYNLVFKWLINGPETNSAAVVDQAAITTFPLGMYFYYLSSVVQCQSSVLTDEDPFDNC